MGVLATTMEHWVFSFALAMAAVPVVFGIFCIFLIYNLPKGPTRYLATWPGLPWLYAQVLAASMIKPAGAVRPHQLAIPVEAGLDRPVAISVDRLARFRSLAQHKQLPLSEVPVMFPIAESFRLFIQAMAMPQFPLNVLGSVLARNRSELLRAVRPEEQLTFKCQVGKACRSNAKGDSEIDLIGSAIGEDSKVVWRSTVTVLVLNKHRSKGPATAAAAVAATAATQIQDRVHCLLHDPLIINDTSLLSSGPEASFLLQAATDREVETWKLDGSVGRRYGLINGDLNPIHLHWLASSLFGFKRPIAHALFLVAKAEAGLRNAGVECTYPCIIETEFKRPTLLPAKLALRVAEGDAAALNKQACTSDGLAFRVVTSDSPTKDVLVGKLLQGEAAAGPKAD